MEAGPSSKIDTSSAPAAGAPASSSGPAVPTPGQTAAEAGSSGGIVATGGGIAPPAGTGQGGGPPSKRGGSNSRKNRIQVSNTKKPLYFYINLSKKFLQTHGEVELSGLGAAITTVVTISEILKNNGLAEEKRVGTSTLQDEGQGPGGPLKVKIEVVLKKSAQFQELMDLAAAEAAVAPPENGHYP